MRKINFKNSDGFAASDAIMAIIIITIFTAIIATLTYNIYLSNTSLKRMSKANNYIVDIFEYIDKTYYEEVNQENVKKYFNEKYYYDSDKVTPKENAEVEAVGKDDEESNTPYRVIVNVQNYNEMEGNNNKLDLVKEITTTVKYKLGNKEQEITAKRVKSREQLITPNKPQLSLISLEQDEKIYPIKERNEKYYVCNENDSSWYSYESNTPALVVITKESLQVGDILKNDTDAKYKWIPRYAINQEDETDIKYLFSNTNNYVEEENGYEKLVDIGTKYVVKSNFQNGDIGIWEKI